MTTTSDLTLPLENSQLQGSSSQAATPSRMRFIAQHTGLINNFVAAIRGDIFSQFEISQAVEYILTSQIPASDGVSKSILSSPLVHPENKETSEFTTESLEAARSHWNGDSFSSMHSFPDFSFSDGLQPNTVSTSASPNNRESNKSPAIPSPFPPFNYLNQWFSRQGQGRESSPAPRTPSPSLNEFARTPAFSESELNADGNFPLTPAQCFNNSTSPALDPTTPLFEHQNGGASTPVTPVQSFNNLGFARTPSFSPSPKTPHCIKTVRKLQRSLVPESQILRGWDIQSLSLTIIYFIQQCFH
ncbi:hypothetical protein BU17DRAFT_98796 [Hysterangium stoloniferum]|nr:hypothetical protein BU17DRAFT_98796 [Hysterangium stoloniferum]